MGLIYRIINTTNNKSYVGQTTRDVKRRFYEHIWDALKRPKETIALNRAIRKYGKESFEVEIIVNNVPNELLDDLEINIIAMYDTFKNGYNCCEGGNGFATTASHPCKNVPKTEEHKRKIGKANSGTKNYKAKPVNIKTVEGKVLHKEITIREFNRLNPNYDRRYLAKCAKGLIDNYKGLVISYV